MTKFEAYLMNTALLEDVLERICNTFPCFINREYVEMNFSKVTITCRADDAEAIGLELTVCAMLS
jgi:hypothetical protein